MADAVFRQQGGTWQQQTAILAQIFAKPALIDLQLVAAVLAQNRRFDLAKSSPATLDLTGLSADQRRRAIAALGVLRLEIKMFPEFDYKAVLASAEARPGTSAGSPAALAAAAPAALAALQNPVRDEISKFLTAANDFDFQTTRINSYLRNSTSPAVAGLAADTKPAVVNQLKRTQRVFRVTSQPEAVTALLGEGLDSAHAIASVPQSLFVKQFSNKLGAQQATAIHAQATVMSASTLNVYRQVTAALNDVTPRAIGPVASTVSAALNVLPDWETLFGSLSFCDCRECQSVLGSAAYFVDLLQFLKKSAKNSNGQTPLDVLLTRRPDLPFIALNCENTTTLLPYIDLVNEILEAYVANADPKAAHNTGDATADELSLNPQYVNPQAYVTLSGAVYPANLPFDRPLEMSRAYLELLNSSRIEVMQAFQLGGDASDFTKGTPSGLALACEYLGISAEEHVILTATDLGGRPVSSTRALPEFYGYPAATTTANLIAALQKAEAILAATGLSYLDLVEVVKARFVNPTQAIALQVPAGADPCDLSQTTLNGLDATALQQIHRFLRLWRRLGWSIEDLDKTIRALGPAVIDDTLLVKLAYVKRLERNLNLPVAQLRSLWSSLDLEGRDSLYLQIFQNKTVLSPVDTAFALLYSAPIAALPAGVTAASLAGVTKNISYTASALQFAGLMTEDEKMQLMHLASNPQDASYASYQLAIDNLFQARNPAGLAIAANNPSATISLPAPAMLAALRISSTDLATLAASENLGDTLDLPTLSQFCRFVALARALKVSVADLGILEKLAGANLVQPSAPAVSSNFVDVAQKVRHSAFSVAQLNYLFRGINDLDKAVAPLDGDVTLFLTGLQAALGKVADGTSATPDPAAGVASVLQQKLAMVLDVSSLNEAMGLLDGTFQFSADLAALPAGIMLPSGVTYDAAAKKLKSTGAISGLERLTLISASADTGYVAAVNDLFQQPRAFVASKLTFLNHADAFSQLIDNTSLATADKQKYVLVRLQVRTNIIKQMLSGNLGLDASITELLLETVLKSSSGNGKAIADFMALAPPYASSPASPSYKLMYKAALLVNGFRMTIKDVTYLAANSADFANFDFNALPVGNAQPAPAQVTALFTQWLRLNDLFTLRDGMADGEAVFDVFQAAAHPSSPPPLPADFAGQLAGAAGWDRGEVSILAGAAGFNLALSDYKNEVRLLPLLSCWNLIQRLGVSAARLFHWAGDPPDPALTVNLQNANEIKNAARAKFNDQTWLTVGKAPSSRLRNAQRDALMAYVQSALGLTESGQLFDHFLIDVETNACMMTSRIVQAVSSVQLFIQRCLMNLESNLDANNKETGVSPSAIDSDQWHKWRKYYRVWEANRQVFLFPENWIEPELRDDKSPFFADLENELLQNDVTARTAEDAFLNYLQKLDQVSRLEIVGTYHDDDADVLHVFGRTFDTPPAYYYRQFTATGVWTAWESVPLDIQGDDLIPVVYERRLYLFWTIINTKAKEDQSAASNTSPLKHCEIQLAWGQYQNGKWSSKQLSQNILLYPTQNGPSGKLPLDVPSSKLANIESLVFKGIVVNQASSEQYLAVRAYIEQAPHSTPTQVSSPVFSSTNRIVVNVALESGGGVDSVIVSIRDYVTGNLVSTGATGADGSWQSDKLTVNFVSIFLVTVSTPETHWNVSDDSVVVPFLLPVGGAQIVKCKFTFRLRGTGDYLALGEFRLGECSGAVQAIYLPRENTALVSPAGMHHDGMMLAENLVGSSPVATVNYLDLLTQDQQNITVLNSTPSAFRLLPPHQLMKFLLPPPPATASTAAISATGTTPLPAASPTLTFTLNPTSLSFATQQAGTSSATQTITLTGFGGASGTATTTFSGANPGDFTVQNNTCQNIFFDLEGGTSTCTIDVAFSPSAGGSRNATLTVTLVPSGQTTGQSHTVTLVGAGASAPTFSPSTLTFPDQAVGTTSATQNIQVNYNGTPAANRGPVTITGDFSAPSVVASGDGETIGIAFRPIASGPRTGTISVTDNLTGTTSVANLSGTGAAPSVTLSPTSLTFAAQAVGTTSPAQIVRLTNTGTAALIVSNVIAEGDFAQVSPPRINLPPGQSVGISVTFSPTSTDVRRSGAGSLIITDNASGAPHTVGLSGTIAVPSLSLSPPSLSFANQTVGTASASQTVTLTNTGTVAVTINSAGITGANSGDFALVNSCGSSLQPNARCTMNVTFKPSGGGSRSAALTVTDNASGASQTVALNGVGGVPDVALYPPSLAFGNQPLHTTSAAQTVTLTNTSSSPLTITSIACSDDFAQTNNYSGVVMPSASCTINVTFTPTASGTRTGAMTIQDSSPGSPQTVSLTGVGAQPAVSLLPTSLTFAVPAVGVPSAAQTATLQNSGTAPLNIAGINITGVGAGDFFYTLSGPPSLAPGGSLSISVTFTPSAGGTRSAQLIITDDASGSPHSVSLTGNVTAAAVALSPSTLTFGPQAVGTTSAAQAVTLTNTGGGPLTVNSISVSGDFAQTSPSANSIAPGASWGISVTFKPTGGGLRAGTLTIVDSATGSPHTVGLTGSGLYSESYEFFYQDDRRTYYVSLPQAQPATPAASQAAAGTAAAATPQVQFYTHFHPHICAFIESLNRNGIAGLLTLANQQLTNDIRPNGPTVFQNQYSPVQSVVALPYPAENVDFNYSSAYGLYNWELFFHAPMLVATRLAANQKFDDAQKWYHYIFNPTLGANSWRVLPFQTTEKDRIEDVLKLLEYTGNDPGTIQARNNFESQLNEWVQNPFNPDAIARLRLIAYQKTVVMRYLDNLIAWGDQLFRQDTMETVNQAIQLYVMAQEILGPRPQLVPSRDGAQDQTYNDLGPKLDDFSNVLVQLENEFPFTVGPASNPAGGGLGLTGTFYFCVPNNSQLLNYWDTVADRLFKIRHCMNIDGVVRQLPLFAPPVPPGLLVRAGAQAVDMASALNDVEAATPYYRFSYVLQKAFELCAEVRAFGASLLSALEKKDGEQLALLRATQETKLLQATLQAKKSQLGEANDNLAGLQASQRLVQYRQQYYQNLIATSPSAFEKSQISELTQAQAFQAASQIVNVTAGAVSLIPDFNVGVSGISSPVATALFGGANLSKELELASRVLSDIASVHTYKANMASIAGSWDRRSQEWTFQAQSAAKELDQIQAQIDAATVRVQIAQTEIDNQNIQISNARAVEDFLRSKYTNQDLYAWMVSQTSSVFFQCYELAYDTAKRAEKAFRFDRGLTESGFIAFGYWDNLKKGLLSGEQLYLDLKRLEAAYLDQNRRDYEISKHISLVLTAPMALISLKEVGQCTLDLPEAQFDADYPGHFMRRVKSVSLTIPCVTGPYTSVNCTLTLLHSKIRILTDTQPAYPEQVSANQKADPRFVYDFAATQSIATSTAQNDSGMFDVNFRDDRYLPFEGAGAISTWQIDLPKDTNAFDFETISDVILNLNYTARDGGGALRQAARSAAASQGPVSAARLFSLKHEFPTEWYKFLTPPSSAASQSLAISLGIERFPFLYRGRKITITQVDLYLQFKDIYDSNIYKLDPANPTPLGDYAKSTALTAYVTPAPGSSAASAAVLQSTPSYLNGLPHAVLHLTAQPGTLGSWLLEARDADVSKIATSLQTAVTAGTTTHYRLKAELIEDIILVCTYLASPSA